MAPRLAKWWITPVAAAFFCGCGEREKPAPESVTEEQRPATEAAGISAVPDMKPEAAPQPEVEPATGPREPRSRAESLGFARHIPADAEALVTFHEGAAAINRVRQMKLWGAATAEIPDRPFHAPRIEHDGFEDLQGLAHEDEEFESGPTMSPLEMFGTEVTLALGKGGTARVAAWLDINRRSARHQMRDVAATLSGREREAYGMHATPAMMLFGALLQPHLYPDLVQDRDAMRSLDAFQMPPVTLAVRAADDRLREAHEILAEPVRYLANYNDMVAPVEIVRAGATFRGYRLIGADFAASIEEAREYMVEAHGEDVLERMTGFLKPREMVALSGILGDYAVAFIGASVDEFQLAESPEHAITHGDILAFADPQLAHPLHGLVFAENDLVTALATHTTSLADLALGLRDGFAAHDRDGRNRDLVALLQIVGERERALRALARHETTGITLVDDGGPRIDARGGTGGMLDFTPPSRFAALGDDPDVAMFLNMSIDARHSNRSVAYKEALFETTYALLMRLMDASASDDASGFDPFAFVRQSATMFENDFRGDFVNIWRAVSRDLRHGLGRESAVVVDLKGTLPAIPGVPEALAGHANSPRVTFLAPVANRERLGTAWENIHASATRITTRVGELQEKEIPVPRPIRSEAGGFSSWFLPLPFFDDEFLPSVTLDDAWFAIGTSRNQSVDLLKRLDALDPRPGGGLHLKVNFRLIARAQREQLATLTANRDALLDSGELDAAEYESMLAKLEAVAAGIEELETLEARCWEEGGTARTRIHLRVRP